MMQILPHHHIAIADTSRAHADPFLGHGGASGLFMRAAAELATRGVLTYDAARDLASEFYPSDRCPGSTIRRMVGIGALVVIRTRKQRAARAAAEPIAPSERCSTCSKRRDAPYSECDRCYGNRFVQLGLHTKRGA